MSVLNTKQQIRSLGLGALSATLMVGFLAGTHHAAAQENTLTLAHGVSRNHIVHTQVLTRWANAVSQGRITVAPENLAARRVPIYYDLVKKGERIQIAHSLPAYHPLVFRMSTVTEVPLRKADGLAATEKIWSLYDQFFASDYKDVKLLGLWTTDPNVLVTVREPVRSLEDIYKLRIRAQTPQQGDTLRALGAIPVDMAASQVHQAMDRGTLDGALMPLSGIIFHQLHKIYKQPLFIVDGPSLGSTAEFLIMNRDAYQQSPARASIDANSGRSISVRAAQAYQGAANGAMGAIQQQGGKVIALSSSERSRWEIALSKVLGDWVAQRARQGLPAQQLLNQF